MKPIKAYALGLVLASMTLLITACGGGGGSTATPTSTTITGSVFAAPIDGAAVLVLNSTGTATIAGPVTTASDGTYSVDIPNASLASDLIISSNYGMFIDEAAGGPTGAGTMAAYVEGGTLTSGSKVALDPSSTIVCDLVTRSSKTFDEAKSIFAAAFGYTPDTSIVPKNAPTSGSDAAQRLAGLRAMAFSQLTYDLEQAYNLGLTAGDQFALLTAIADDLADGTLDGDDGATVVSLGTGTMPEDIGNRFEQSLITMLTNTTVNLTGLLADQIGTLPFAKVALTPTYRVEYLPGMPVNAAMGKTTFKLKITKRSDGSPATGLTVSLMPMMHMSTMKHATPVDVITESSTLGTYDCTVYYIMASTGMGYWELKVMIGSGMSGETTTFYPPVGSAAAIPKLRGQSDDLITKMGGTETRTYYLLKDGPTTTTSISLFIAAQENMKMSFSQVYSGATFTDQSGNPMSVTSVSVDASTNPSDSGSWQSGTNTGGGHWTLPVTPNLSSEGTGTVYVRLFVNGVQKSTDGLATGPTNTNGYQTLVVTDGI